jgi:surface polysaccharide O-acyltransferase-like enzyme
MLFNTKIKEKISKNSIKIITATYFSIFLFIGILTFKDYGFNIDEKFQRLNGFYWLNYYVPAFPACPRQSPAP